VRVRAGIEWRAGMRVRASVEATASVSVRASDEKNQRSSVRSRSHSHYDFVPPSRPNMNELLEDTRDLARIWDLHHHLKKV
jgi:hypothetical protein